MALTVKEILNHNHADVRRVSAYGGTVCVRSMTGNDRDAIEQRFRKQQIVGIRAQVVAACLCDDAGAYLAPELKEVAQLGKTNSKDLDAVFQACCEVSGLTEKDVEDIEKNLPSVQSDDSG